MESPIGRHLHYVARLISKSFNAALTEAGGSLPTWLVLLAVKRIGADTQGELARAVGIEGPTLTHHLDGMERDGLVVRRRPAENRRVVKVELTAAGEKTFARLYQAAADFDRQLRRGVSAEEVAMVHKVLTRLGENAGGSEGDI